MPVSLPLGYVMLDLQGRSLAADDRERLLHPQVGGVILFTRNYASPSQIAQLCLEIHGLRDPQLLIAVDHEGGRVQRFREGFTQLPPMRALGAIWDEHPQRARRLAHDAGYVLAAELRACGVDLSFTPVLDLDFGSSAVIGNRAFHAQPQAVSELAVGLMEGLRQGGMAAVGKHFPGHGFVEADSHTDLPVDHRGFAEIEVADLLPFGHLIRSGLAGIMPAHVMYPKVDDKPAGFSRLWLADVLRNRMQFDGVIFSDDLNMEGARVAGDIVQRGQAAIDAGCDMILVCNNPAAADKLLFDLRARPSPITLVRMARLRGHAGPPSMAELRNTETYSRAVHSIAAVGMDSGEGNLAGGPPVGESG